MVCTNYPLLDYKTVTEMREEPGKMQKPKATRSFAIISTKGDMRFYSAKRIK